MRLKYTLLFEGIDSDGTHSTSRSVETGRLSVITVSPDPEKLNCPTGYPLFGFEESESAYTYPVPPEERELRRIFVMVWVPRKVSAIPYPLSPLGLFRKRVLASRIVAVSEGIFGSGTPCAALV